MQEFENKKEKLAQRRRGAKGRKRLGRLKPINARPKVSAVHIRFASLLSSSLSSSLRLCVSARESFFRCRTCHSSNPLPRRGMPSFIRPTPTFRSRPSLMMVRRRHASICLRYNCVRGSRKTLFLRLRPDRAYFFIIENRNRRTRHRSRCQRIERDQR